MVIAVPDKQAMTCYLPGYSAFDRPVSEPTSPLATDQITYRTIQSSYSRGAGHRPKLLQPVYKFAQIGPDPSP